MGIYILITSKLITFDGKAVYHYGAICLLLM